MTKKKLLDTYHFSKYFELDTIGNNNFKSHIIEPFYYIEDEMKNPLEEKMVIKKTNIDSVKKKTDAKNKKQLEDHKEKQEQHKKNTNNLKEKSEQKTKENKKRVNDNKNNLKKESANKKESSSKNANKKKNEGLKKQTQFKIHVEDELSYLKKLEKDIKQEVNNKLNNYDTLTTKLTQRVDKINESVSLLLKKTPL